MIVYFARVHGAALAHEFEQEFGLFAARGGPGTSSFCRHAAIGAWMHQRLQRPCYKAVVDEEVFLDAELRITALEIAIAIVLNAMSQHQVLRSRRSAYGIGLHKAQPVERTLQRGGREETTSNSVVPQIQKVLIRRFRTSIFIAAFGRRCNWIPISPCILRPAVSSSISALMTRPLIS